jgi:hypothetical protein
VNWTTAADLRAQVQKLWDKGDLLRPLVQGGGVPAQRLRLVGPSSTDLTERFDEVRAWMADLLQAAANGSNSGPHPKPGYRVVLREFKHRVLGANSVPDAVWLDRLDDALAMIGKHKDAKRFAGLVQMTSSQHSALLPWLERRPLNALALVDVWPRLLAVVAWLQVHPRPGIFLRQVDIPAVDSKFIEAHRGVITELLDLALPIAAIDAGASGVSQFCRRYGFKDKPLRIRFRLLDPNVTLLPFALEPDISVTQAVFERLDLPVSRVFITENEVNFLAFPAVLGSLVIFGAGYGFENLADARWLTQRSVYYWGDIDTHGFAILDQLRSHLPHVQSLLMDRATLLAHASQWGDEPQPLLRDLPRLTTDESALFNDLRDNRLRTRLRLEQERIGFGYVQQVLTGLPKPSLSRPQ